jgi:hypothetical protein
MKITVTSILVPSANTRLCNYSMKLITDAAEPSRMMMIYRSGMGKLRQLVGCDLQMCYIGQLAILYSKECGMKKY